MEKWRWFSGYDFCQKRMGLLESWWPSALYQCLNTGEIHWLTKKKKLLTVDTDINLKLQLHYKRITVLLWVKNKIFFFALRTCFQKTIFMVDSISATRLWIIEINKYTLSLSYLLDILHDTLYRFLNILCSNAFLASKKICTWRKIF